jgi:quinol monooxygenase YgiN
VSINEIRKCTNLMAQNEIHFRLELTIESSKIAECKKLVQEMVKVVEANEPDVINYEYYLNNVETSCVIIETYKNSDAAHAHLKGIASQTILPKIFNISRITRFDVYGDPGEELQKVLTAFGVQLYKLFAGFSR